MMTQSVSPGERFSESLPAILKGLEDVKDCLGCGSCIKDLLNCVVWKGGWYAVVEVLEARFRRLEGHKNT